MLSEDFQSTTSANSFLGQMSMNQSSSSTAIPSTLPPTNSQLFKKNGNGPTALNQQVQPQNGYLNQNTLSKAGTEKENIQKYADSEPIKAQFQAKPQFYGTSFISDEAWVYKQQIQQQQQPYSKQSQQYESTGQKQVVPQQFSQEVPVQHVYFEDTQQTNFDQQDLGQNNRIQPDVKAEPTFQELMHQIDQEHDSEDEGIQDYKIGGYHPVHIGEVINGRYVVIQKIGWGHFSTVWLTKDFKYDTYVALKIQKSAPHYLEAAFDEVEILQKVASKSKEPAWMKCLQHYYEGEKKKSFNKNDCQVVQLLNSFIYKGPYGNHFCFIFEILGVNLLEVIKRYNYQGVPMHLCRKIAKQVLIGLDFLHRFCSVIHTDLKPENVLLQLTNEEIADIVDNGQITKNQLFKERLKIIRKHLGIEEEIEEEKILPPPAPTPAAVVVEIPPPVIQQGNPNAESDDELSEEGEKDNSNIKELEAKLKQPGLNKKQKKNLRKKINKKKKKLESDEKQEENEIQQEQSNNNPTMEPSLPAPTLESQSNQVPPPIDQKALFSQPDSKLLDKNKMMRGPQLDENFKLKIADLGNACWTFHHFATEIQTRQYRSPEVITGSKYNETADVWSLACMLFEMLTGDFLFEPRKGPTFSKNDDHLAQIEELCKKFPKSFAKRGEKSKKYFDNNGNLRRIPQLQYWPLRSVLIEKYRMKEKEARAFEDFMMPMLHCVPEKRATAQQMLEHPWLKGPTTVFEYKQTEQEHADYVKRKQIQMDIAKLQGEDYVDLNQENTELQDDDIYDGDGENTDNDFYNNKDEEEFYGYKDEVNLKLVDRSFTNLGYIGFGDGIDFGALDNTGNWQFSNV